MTSRSLVLSRAHLADALTGSRFVFAVLAIPLVSSGAWRASSLVVVLAWWTDFFDGRVARSTTGTRLGEWDPYADTAVGAGVVIGLAAGGHVLPVPWLVVTGGFVLAYLVGGNFAFGQIAQALGYGPLLWFATRADLVAISVLVGTIVVIAIFDARRFVSVTLPTFFEGVGLRKRSG